MCGILTCGTNTHLIYSYDPLAPSVCLVCLLLFICIYFGRIIGRRYKQIQQIIKDVILNMLFDTEFLKRYISQQLQKTSTSLQIKDSIESALSSVEAGRCVADHLDQVYREPEGYDLEQLGLTRQQVHSVIKPFVLGLCAESAPLVMQELSDGTEVSNEVALLHCNCLRIAQWGPCVWQTRNCLKISCVSI